MGLFDWLFGGKKTTAPEKKEAIVKETMETTKKPAVKKPAIYKYRLELNETTYQNDEVLYRYDVFDADLDEYPDGYNSFMKDNYDGEHISSADNGNIEDYAFYEGKFNWEAEEELNDKYEDGYTENVDELGAFETLKDVKKFVKKDSDERFPNSGFEL